MHKKLCAILFSVLTAVQVPAAWADAINPDALSIKQSKTCYRCVSLMDQGRPFSFLQHNAQNWDEFYYFDADKQKLLTITKKGSYLYGPNDMIVVFFDVLDKNDLLVAKLRFFYDPMGFAFSSFQILSIDSKHILIESSPSLTGTGISIYDRTLKTYHEIARISRPLFTWSLDSELTVIDKPDLLFIIDPNIFYAALALNANTDLFYSIEKSKTKKIVPSASPETLQKLRKKILDYATMRGITLYAQSTDLSKEELAAAEQLLIQQYAQMTGGGDWNTGNLDKDKQLENLVNFGCDYLLSHSQNQREEYAVLQFLTNQLN